ncbi:MAG TPA: trypsin-like peptidase domain-containing protein [Verrucomicrobiales bacterium]|nr:trypsin-like peptidase domain-containing protein [Verrucomicrobiales bacterium]
MKHTLSLSVPALSVLLALGLPNSLLFSQETTQDTATTSLGAQYEAIVNIECSSLDFDYQTPWNPATPGGGSGTGFMIAPNLFMTNAHVVSDASRLSIKKVGDPTPYRAKVKFIAHDCDLALLELLKPAKAFEKVKPLNIGNEVPKLDTTVKVVGFPIGGERISVTRGVVSRVDYQEYTHSGVDQHLAIQIDAAINPGNSGGPVLQGNAVIGVAFQGYSGSVAQNTGYMIPVPVMKRFLKDVEDGRYDRYVDLSIAHFEILNAAQRAALHLPENDAGVLVAHVDEDGSCGGVLKPGDVLLAIDGHPIESNGSIDIDGEQMEMAEVVERKFAGDKLKLTVWRGNKSEDLEITLKNTGHYLMTANKYEQRPQYVIFAGMVFQPMDSPLMASHSFNNLRTRYFYQYFSTDALYKERPQPVLFTSVLPDSINTYSREFTGQIVDQINGVKILQLKDVADALTKDTGNGFVTVKLLGEGRPIVIDAKAAEAAQKRILDKYNVESAAYIE